MTQSLDIAYEHDELALRRRLRVLVLLEAAANAGLEPVPLLLLHTMAYLSNALAPIWNLDPFDGAVLKRRGGPYYPSLQWDVDRMVGSGLIKVEHVRYVQEDKRWRVDANYCLNRAFVRPVMDTLKAVGFESELTAFCAALAQALSALPPDQIAMLLSQDAAYGNPAVDVSNVVNLAENHGVNFAANAAESFRPDVSLTAAERVHLYVNHLHTRLARYGH